VALRINFQISIAVVQQSNLYLYEKRALAFDLTSTLAGFYCLRFKHIWRMRRKWIREIL